MAFSNGNGMVTSLRIGQSNASKSLNSLYPKKEDIMGNQNLMKKYGFASKKSITDKVKKHFPNEYSQIVKEAQENRKGYTYCLKNIESEFDAYFLGLLLTDGYISRGTDIGIDLIDEDCISFLSKVVGKPYKTYQYGDKKPKHRLIFSNYEMVKNLERLGVVPNKSLILQPPQLTPEEEKFLPYIIRGIIDGDGCVSPTSYGGAQFYIVSASKDFIDWVKYILEYKLFMRDLHLRVNNEGVYRLETAHQDNILKLIALVYDKPFGMSRKYNELRETFRDYNSTLL